MPMASSTASTLSPAAHPGNCFKEGSRSKSELEAPIAQEVQGGGRLGHHRGWPQRKIGDRREDPDPRGPGQQMADQDPSVEEAPLVGMVLNPDEIEPGALGGDRLGEHVVAAACVRTEEYAELERGHRYRAALNPSHVPRRP